MLFVTGQERARRLQICQSCKYYKENTKSCGTILRPNTLRNGVYLCGCHMPTKTRFKASSCGAGLWEEQITEADLVELRELADLKGTITREQVKEMIDTYNRATGSNQKYTGCSSCVQQIQKKIQAMVDHDHEKEIKEASRRAAGK